MLARRKIGLSTIKKVEIISVAKIGTAIKNTTKLYHSGM